MNASNKISTDKTSDEMNEALIWSMSTVHTHEKRNRREVKNFLPLFLSGFENRQKSNFHLLFESNINIA